MIELIGCFAGGFIVFFIALVRYSGDHRHFSREAPRTAPVLFAVFWLVSVVALAVIAIETVFALISSTSAGLHVFRLFA